MTAISWGVLGLMARCVGEVVDEDEATGRRRGAMYALAVGGGLIGGLVGAVLGLASFSWIHFGAWHTALAGAALALWIYGGRR